MRISRARAVQIVIVGGVLSVFGFAGMLKLNAQAISPFQPTTSPLTSILDGINEILAVLKPGPTDVHLSTGFARAETDDSLLCLSANVGSSPIGPVEYRAVNTSGTVGPSGSSGTVQPGAGAGGGGNVAAGFWRCEFSFEGQANSVRATMVIRQGLSGPGRFVLDAR